MSTTFEEPAREVPVAGDVDVFVAGGGAAGVFAAIAAARTGARVQLCEAKGQLGGLCTTGLLPWIIDAENKNGLVRDFLEEVYRRTGHASSRESRCAFDVEHAKRILEAWCLDAGVNVQYHTQVATGYAREGRLRTAVTESKSGRQAWRAKIFIDATGDGDLAARAGCGFDMGREGTGEMQPMSLICALGGLDPEAVRPFYLGDSKPKQLFREAMEAGGVSPSYGAPTLFYAGADRFVMMANHEYRVSGLDAAQITAATLRSRAESHTQIEALRGQGGPWRNLRLLATGEHIGVRETRRIRGHYTVTVDDLMNGARHDDAVCRVTFCIDVHSTDPEESKAISQENRGPVQPYDIPLRALIARDLDGLMTAGRCISGDFLAHSSYRVMGNAAATGESAGVVAALAARSERLPQEIPVAEFKPRIPALA